jgi:hypothetical protein
MIDLVTVVFDQEINTLQSQAQSVDLYCQNLSINHIYVVINDHSSVAGKIDTAWWGNRANSVRIVNRHSLTDCVSSNGWVDQQLLKLLAAAAADSTWSLVLDAKTIFVREFSDRTVFENNRASVGALPVFSVFAPSKKIVEETFEINFEQQLGPGGVPFVFHNRTVRNLIAFIEAKYSQPFAEWFLGKGSVTEFMLYSGYVQYQSLNSQLYNVQFQIQPCNICHSEVLRFDDKLDEAENSHTVSIHRNAWNQLSPDQQLRYQNFLAQKGVSYK